jgi:hypothetical protein
MLTKRKGKRHIRLALTNVSRFSPGAARAFDSSPRRPPAKTIEQVATARLPTESGEFRSIGYRSLTSAEKFVALVRGELRADHPTLVRIHSQCLTGDVFGSVKCDCGHQISDRSQARAPSAVRGCASPTAIPRSGPPPAASHPQFRPAATRAASAQAHSTTDTKHGRRVRYALPDSPVCL